MKKDVREKLTDIFTEQCKMMINEKIISTNAKIENLEDTSKHHCRISQLKKKVDDTEQDRRGTNLIIKGIKITDIPKIDFANIIS